MKPTECKQFSFGGRFHLTWAPIPKQLCVCVCVRVCARAQNLELSESDLFSTWQSSQQINSESVIQFT
jgi:hypothetical protein